MCPCKHLDFSIERYGESADLVTMEGFDCAVQHWRRKESLLPYPEAPLNVQFCGQGRGRINGIFQCYNPGEMPCYEAAR